MESFRQSILDAQMTVHSLVIYRNILKDPIVKAFTKILNLTLEEALPQVLISNYHEFLAILITQSEISIEQIGRAHV